MDVGDSHATTKAAAGNALLRLAWGVQVAWSSAEAPDKVLLQYLRSSCQAKSALSFETVRALLARCVPGGIDWSLRSESGLPILHLAVVNLSTPAETIVVIVLDLVRHGAPLDATDSDGDTAFDVAMLMAEYVGEEDNEDEKQRRSRVLLAALTALLRCSGFDLKVGQVFQLCHWVHQYFPEAVHEQFLGVLRAKAGNVEVEKAWSSLMLLRYLEDCAYVSRRGVLADRVRLLLQRGADPGLRANTTATAFITLTLNPYSEMEQLAEVFRLMLSTHPHAALVPDGFGRSALEWAADYRNVSKQHSLKQPNPSALLALLPALASSLPRELDAGEVCFQVSDGAFCSSERKREGMPQGLRFRPGDHVKCRVQVNGASRVWREGTVVGVRYREVCWPRAHRGAPYEVLLDNGSRVFALVDDDRIVRRKGASTSDRPSQCRQAATARTPVDGAMPELPEWSCCPDDGHHPHHAHSH